MKRVEGDCNSIYFSDFLKVGEEEKWQSEVEERTATSSPEDLANILYTSGTTGDSKGVMLHHFNYEAALKGIMPVLQSSERMMWS